MPFQKGNKLAKGNKNGLGNSYRLGKKHTDKTRKKISDSRKGKNTGKNNWTWKGGITSEHQKVRDSVEYKAWRLDVFERDNYTCQKCDAKGVYLEAHHIENFNTSADLRIILNNGITLCYKCHRKFHNIYGNKNNKEQLKNYLI